MPPYVRYPHELREMVKTFLDVGISPLDVADDLHISHQWVYKLRKQYIAFGEVSTPSLSALGRPRTLHTAAVASLQEFYAENPQAYLYEAKAFLEDEHNLQVSTSTLCRQMKRMNFSNKRTERHYPSRDDQLREDWVIRISHFEAHQLIFVDESAADKRNTDRRIGWSPRGVACRVSTNGRRSRRWSLLPALGLNGYLYYEIHHGSVSQECFNTFIQRLLQYCTPYPGPRSVIILDNASVYRSAELKEMCRDAGVRLLFLPPYSPDFNAIEESFAGIKAWIRRKRELITAFGPYFEGFLQMAIQEAVTATYARGYFRSAGIRVNEAQTDVIYKQLWAEVEPISA